MESSPVGQFLHRVSRPVLFGVFGFFSVYDCPPNFAFFVGQPDSWVLAVVAVNCAEVFLGDAFSLVRHLHFPTLSAVVAFVNKVNFPVAHFYFFLVVVDIYKCTGVCDNTNLTNKQLVVVCK